MIFLNIWQYDMIQNFFVAQVVNWSTWLSALVSCKDRVPAEFRSSLPDDAEDEEPVQFNLLKATGDLLMLPKDILLDAEIRKEVYLAISCSAAVALS